MATPSWMPAANGFAQPHQQQSLAHSMSKAPPPMEPFHMPMPGHSLPSFSQTGPSGMLQGWPGQPSLGNMGLSPQQLGGTSPMSMPSFDMQSQPGFPIGGQFPPIGGQLPPIGGQLGGQFPLVGQLPPMQQPPMQEASIQQSGIQPSFIQQPFFSQPSMSQTSMTEQSMQQPFMQQPVQMQRIPPGPPPGLPPGAAPPSQLMETSGSAAQQFAPFSMEGTPGTFPLLPGLAPLPAQGVLVPQHSAATAPILQPPMRPQPQPMMVPDHVDSSHWMVKGMLEEDMRVQKRARAESVEEPERKGPQDLEDYQQRIFLEQLAEKKRKLEQKASEKAEREKLKKDEEERQKKEKEELEKREEEERLEKKRFEEVEAQRLKEEEEALQKQKEEDERLLKERIERERLLLIEQKKEEERQKVKEAKEREMLEEQARLELKKQKRLEKEREKAKEEEKKAAAELQSRSPAPAGVEAKAGAPAPPGGVEPKAPPQPPPPQPLPHLQAHAAAAQQAAAAQAQLLAKAGVHQGMCFNCGQPGHIAGMCPRGKVGQQAAPAPNPLHAAIAQQLGVTWTPAMAQLAAAMPGLGAQPQLPPMTGLPQTNSLQSQQMQMLARLGMTGLPSTAPPGGMSPTGMPGFPGMPTAGMPGMPTAGIPGLPQGLPQGINPALLAGLPGIQGFAGFPGMPGMLGATAGFPQHPQL